MQEVVSAYKDSSDVKQVQSTGLHIAGERFIVIKADDRSIYGKKVRWSEKKDVVGGKRMRREMRGGDWRFSEEWGSMLRICDFVDLMGPVFADDYDFYRAEKAS
jgi:hypothetical protein